MALRKRRRRLRHRYFHLRSRHHNHHPLQQVQRRLLLQRRHRQHRRHRLQRVLPLLRRRPPPLLQLSQRLSWLPMGQQFCLCHHCHRLKRVHPGAAPAMAAAAADAFTVAEVPRCLHHLI